MFLDWHWAKLKPLQQLILHDGRPVTMSGRFRLTAHKNALLNTSTFSNVVVAP